MLLYSLRCGGVCRVAWNTRAFLERIGARRCFISYQTQLPDQFLLDEGVRPYTEMPLWVPASLGHLNMPIERALAAGLRHRDVDETLRDTRAWAESLDGAVSQID